MEQLINKFSRGQIIVELLVAFGLASVLIPVVVVGLISGTGGRAQSEQRVKALGLLKEGEEAVRSIRESDWNNITTPSVVMSTSSLDEHPYHPVEGTTSWSLSPGSETVGDFTRSITFSDINPIDPSLKKVTVTVSWGGVLPSDVSSTFFLTRWKNINATLDAGGKLTGLGYGDWCNPSLTITAVDLPKNGVANAISAIQGQVVAGTGDNASGVSFANVNITDPNYPTNPVATISGTFDGFKTNDVFTEQDYAYLATDNQSKEVEIINLLSKDSNGKYAEAGYFDATGQVNGNAVATSGNVGYMVASSGGPNPPKLYSFDLSSKSGSRPKLDPDGVTLPGQGKRIAIHGSRVYVVTDSTSAQLVIVDVSDPSDLKITKQIGLPAAAGAAIYLNSTGTRAYVATHQSTTQRELFIVNIDETSPDFGNIINSYDTNGMDPRGLVVVNIPRIIIVGVGGQEYQVVNIENEAQVPLTECGGLNVDTGINGISTVFTAASRAYSYIITGDATSELKIIEGGAGGVGGGNGGTFESPILNIGRSVIFNRFSEVSKTPSSIMANYAVAVSPDCTTFNYTGNYDSSGGVIPLNINPGNCFRFKVVFSGGGTASTASAVIRVNYSP